MKTALAAGTMLGPYEIDSLIGAGGMGQVYRARDSRLGRQVAVKTLTGAGASDPDLARRFETEAKAAGGLDHPNLLVVYDVGRQNDVSYIVSELLDGETLRARLARGALTPRQATDYTIQIARGLAAAHARGIIHRDLKPENLFLTHDGRVKILDFGVAKLIEAPNTDAATRLADATGAGVIVGTAGYMAPEQVRGEPIDHRADIFALGVVLHEMLSGVRPFRGDTTPETLTAILRDDAPELPASVTPALQRVIGKCLDKRRENRFHSAHDLGLALELLSTADTASSFTPIERPAGLSRRKAILYGASSVALVASGLAGAAFLGRSTPPAQATFRRLTFRRGLIRSARVAPDGQTVLYGALWDGDPCRVHASRVDSTASNPIDLPDANVLAISRSGEVALAMGPQLQGTISYGTLARVPIAGGVPRQLVEDVKFADWSPDGSELAIVRRVDGRDRLEFPIGKVLVEPKFGDSTGLGFARVSPDGTQVAFVQYRSPATLVGRVSITDLTGAVTPLSGEYLNIHGLAWNGSEICYTAADEGVFYRTVRAVRPGRTERTITRMPGNVTLWDVLPDGRLLIAHTDDRTVMIARSRDDADERDLSWFDGSIASSLTRDGRRLLFSEYGLGGGRTGGVYLRGFDGSPAVRLSDGRAGELSPDGRWAICFSLALPSPYIDLVPTGAGDRRRVPETGLVYFNARWLRDGKRVVVAGAEPGHGARLFLLDVDHGRPAALTPEGLTGWTLSPDATTLAVRGPDPAITLYSLDGAAPKALPGTAESVPLSWVDEGLLVQRPSDRQAPLGQVYKVDATSGQHTPWRNILPGDRAGIMSLSSFQVTPDGGSEVYSWHRALSSLYLAEDLA